LFFVLFLFCRFPPAAGLATRKERLFFFYFDAGLASDILLYIFIYTYEGYAAPSALQSLSEGRGWRSRALSFFFYIYILFFR
jgi:hypothetical protein